ncbi:hypothetical protein OSTOST_06024 [Ostertagia ostertagi]
MEMSIVFAPVLSFQLPIDLPSGDEIRAVPYDGRNNERFDLLLSALHWERKMSMVLQRGIRPLTDIFIEEQNIYSKLHVIGQLESLYWKAKQYKRDGGYAAGLSHNDLTELSVSANAVIRHDNHTSKKALYYFNFIHALYYWMIKDYKNGYLSSKALLNAEIQAVMPSDYMDGLLEFVNASFCMGYFEQCLTGLKVARVYFEVQSLGLTQSYAMKLFAYESVYLLMVYNFMGNTEALDKTIENVVDKFGSNSRFLPLDVQQVILGNMMNAYVGAGNLNKAISIWSGLFKKKTRETVANTYLCKRCQGWLYTFGPKPAERQPCTCHSRDIRETWDNFPTQSPVCNGDDGISTKLDGITFPKWRTESIKAGGNAIVPQVAFQIFKVINEFLA